MPLERDVSILGGRYSQLLEAAMRANAITLIRSDQIARIA
jgi:hypothetical protein